MATQNLQVSSRAPETAQQCYVVEAGDPFVLEIQKGSIVRIVDIKGNQAVDTLFYNAHDHADPTARKTRFASRGASISQPERK